ncbi:MAG: hypothetical protein Fur0042_03160 [Cyanophyceae cyanobacterium]
MFAKDELANLEKNIHRLRQQLQSKRDVLVTIAPEEQTRIEQQIADLREKIAKLERDYWELLNQQAISVELTDDEAEPIAVEWVERAGQLAIDPPSDVPAEVLERVQTVAQKAADPGQSAAVKVKGMISALPPFFSLGVEAELDVAAFLQRNFPTFCNWAGALAKK